MIYDKEMSKYRKRIVKERRQNGRRSTDMAAPPFVTSGIVWEVVFLIIFAMWLMSGCAGQGAL